MIDRKIVTFGIALLALVVLASFASAGPQLLCLNEGEEVKFSDCNPAIPDRKCSSSLGCNFCVTITNSGAFCPTNINTCNSQGFTCSGAGGGTSIDQEPPEIRVISPTGGVTYKSRSVPFDVFSSERSEIHFIDNNDPRGRWTRLCSKCTHYERSRNLKEGLNDLTFRATDNRGNEAFFDVVLSVDSQSPRISSTKPKRGFTSGKFTVEFQEESPVLLVLHYGLPHLMNQKELDINSECMKDRNHVCATQVDLSLFDGDSIQYWFELTDVAGGTDQSNPVTVDVDFSPPVFGEIVQRIDGKNVHFSVEVEEAFLAEVVYIDDLDPRRVTEKKLCNSLANLCEKRIVLRDGPHNIRIIARDKAGNEAEHVFDPFLIDSKLPRIKLTNPRRGFANGEFEVEFIEENPQNLMLHYGTDSDLRSHTLNLGNDCVPGVRSTHCSVAVDLGGFDGEDVEYWFELSDVMGQEASSRPVSLGVDVSFPKINSLNIDINGRDATFVIDVTEDNLDEVTYEVVSDSRSRERRLCSRLNDGVCKKRVRFREGDHDLTFRVYDEAGHQVGESRTISI